MDIKTEVKKIIDIAAATNRQRTNVDIRDLLGFSFERVLLAASGRNGGVMAAESYKAAMAHVIDWLTSSRLRNEDWLSRLDDQGRPVKLMKFGTFEQMVNEADKATRKWRNEGHGVEPEVGSKAVHDAGDGYVIYRLSTPEALDHEGRLMGHCVGEGAYDYGLQSNFLAVYSLRDRFGKSHVTIEIDNVKDEVLQIKGKQNEPPKADYMRRLIGWKGVGQGMKIDKDELPARFAIDKKRGLIDLATMNPGDVFEGDLTFAFKAGEEHRVPIAEGVVVNGNISIRGDFDPLLWVLNGSSEMAELALPKALKVTGEIAVQSVRLDGCPVDARSFRARTCDIRSFPPAVKGNVVIEASSFSGEVRNVTFKDNVDIRDCRGLRIGEGAVFERGFTLKQCRKPSGMSVCTVVDIGEGSVFEGDVLLHASAITMRGDLSFGGNLKITECDDIRMPRALTVTKDLTLYWTTIDHWPEDHTTVGGQCVETELFVVDVEMARKYGTSLTP
jgi:hypothetical protein